MSFLAGAGGTGKEQSGDAGFLPEKAAGQLSVEEREGQGAVQTSPAWGATGKSWSGPLMGTASFPVPETKTVHTRADTQARKTGICLLRRKALGTAQQSSQAMAAGQPRGPDRTYRPRVFST